MKPRDNEAIAAALAAYAIGPKLRTLRAERNLTLAQLAWASGFSQAMLSKLESSSMVPTLQTLMGICRVYGVGLGYFFYEPKQHSLAITRKAHLAIKEVLKAPRRIPLHIETSEARQTSTIILLPPGTVARIGENRIKNEITVYILEGTLHIDVTKSQEVLEQGDCIALKTDQPVIWSNPADTPCRFLCVAAS